MILKDYYNNTKSHDYMDVDGYDIIIMDYLKSLRLEDKTVLEIGSGSGRYTNCLASVSAHTIATEPNEHMYSLLNENFSSNSNISIIKADLEELAKQPPDNKVDYIFLFHVLHHLPYKEWKNVMTLSYKLNAKLIIVEPNHINPLFFIQILITKDMTYKEEKGMFRDNSKHLIQNYGNGSQANRFYIGWLPRGLNNTLSSRFGFLAQHKKFKTKIANPFSAYSILEITN